MIWETIHNLFISLCNSRNLLKMHFQFKALMEIQDASKTIIKYLIPAQLENHWIKSNMMEIVFLEKV